MVPHTDQQEPKRFGVWGVICICAAVVCAVAPATWYVARAQVSDQLAQYEQSKYWKLPENLTALAEVSKKLNTDMEMRKDLESTKGQKSKTHSEISCS